MDRLPPGSQHAARLDLILRQAQALFALGQVQVALDLLASQPFGVILAQDDELASRYALLMSQLHRHQQAWAEVSQQARHAIEAAARCEDDVAGGQACVLLAEARYWSSAFQDGMASGQRAVRLLEASAERFQLAMAYFLVGLNARALGSFADAQRAIEHMRVVGSTIDDPHVLPFSDWAMGWIQATYGAWDDAIAACRRSLEQAPDQLSTALALGWLGYAHVEKGEAVDAVGFLEQAVYHVRQLQRQRLEAMFSIFWGGALLATGDLASAREVTQQGLTMAQASNYRYGIAWGQRTQGRVALALQSASDAKRDFLDAMATFTDMGARFEVGRTHLAMAQAAALEGESAEGHLTEALTIFNQLQVSYYIEQTRQRQGELRHL